MASQDDQNKHYKNLVEAAGHFTDNAKAKYYKDPQTGELISWQNAYKELYGLLPKYKSPDPIELFQQIHANKDSDPLIKQYLNATVDENSDSQTVRESEDESHESQVTSQEKEEAKEPEKIFKESYVKKEEETPDTSLLDDSKTSDSLNEQTSNEQPVNEETSREEPVIPTAAEGSSSSVIPASEPESMQEAPGSRVVARDDNSGQNDNNEQPVVEPASKEQTNVEPSAPKFDLKPLPITPIITKPSAQPVKQPIVQTPINTLNQKPSESKF